MINNLKNFGTVDPELKIILGPCVESLSISGDWTNTQYAGSPVDYTGLTFTVTYNNGTTASVTPTSISPSVWGSTVGEQTCTFIYEENGFEVSANKSANVVESWLPVGGVIYAIDSTATGTYRFKNASGVEVSAPSVGTDCTGWSYIVSNPNKDRFYIRQKVNRLNYTDQGGYIKWASSGEDLSGYSSQIEVLSSANTLLGKGRSNTNFIMTVKASDSNYFFTGSIWQLCKNANNSALDGCSDWYIPSIGEMSYIRSSFSSKADFINWARNSSQTSAGCWSSSANSNTNTAWNRLASNGYDVASSYPRYDQSYGYCSCLSRSF